MLAWHESCYLTLGNAAAAVASPRQWVECLLGLHFFQTLSLNYFSQSLASIEPYS